MRFLTVTGHLGADPEFKSTKNGATYASFRLANNEFEDKDENGSQVTYWYTVFVWDSALQNLCKVLKKGSSITVVGRVSDRVYISQRTGMPEIGRDIKASMIFFNTGMRKDDEDQASHEPSKQQQPAAKSAAPAPAQAPAAAPAPQAAATVEVGPDSNEDDLPF